ncbi:recombinase family protein [Sphingobacterium zeae]|uniref:DNA invertase Pin-like site-specific DNA recombinase n=1 Tax=Sphingobacterium zeae TaxID=1776859 RepID=A0ABU0U4V2_9SPHI|nr:recombinase family protein [Sphingobacterium zeae]MDQ1149276.1 DNA invertase Pin-like site-specific DNA recombinase [Sphingobacterium zeae]
MKKGIRYLRFSSDGQSLHSIERQDLITRQWMNNSGVEIVDTFIDEGHTARNFDRPDIKVLFDFIKKNHDQIDYLVVAELTRSSRIAGDAINMVTKIQALYDVRIVSASRGSIYDCMDHNSFFIMGLEFLMGNSENIKRQNYIDAGIYTAKAIKGL